MDQPFESDVMDDLTAEPPLSSADDYDDDYDDMVDRYDEEESFTDDMDNYGDSSDGLGDLDSYFDAAIHQELSTGAAAKEGTGLGTAIAEALAAPDSRAFLRRLSQSLRQMAEPAAQSDRQLDRQLDRPGRRTPRTTPTRRQTTQPPATVARLANLAAQLVREEAEPREALDAFLELAETDRANAAVVPVIAGLSLHQALPQVARSSRSQRQQLVQSVSRATQTLAQQQGTHAMAAMPRILEVIDRNAIANHLPQTELPGAIQRITRQVATNADLIHRLIHPTQTTHPKQATHSIHSAHATHAPHKNHSADRMASRHPRQAAKPNEQRLVFDRPVEISIRYL